MYSQSLPRRPSRRTLQLFESGPLLDAVRHVSSSLVKRAGIASSDSAYASLLTDIWGQSHFATSHDLIRKRSQDLGKHVRQGLNNAAKQAAGMDTPLPDRDVKAEEVVNDVRSLKIQKRNAARDKLVRLLRRVEEDSLAASERRLTCTLAEKEGNLDVEELRKLWGVPQAVFQAAELDDYFRQHGDARSISQFYERYISRASPDSRIFNVLYWKENYDVCCHDDSVKSNQGTLRSISKSIIAEVVRLLLKKRRCPLFEDNMDVVIEIVLYAMNPDRFVDRFRESFLREASFFQGLRGYEYSRSYTGALENLQFGKLNRMLKDMRAVKAIDEQQNNFRKDSNLLSLRAVAQYCAERDTLTERALRAVYGRYVRHKSSTCAGDECESLVMSEADFARMYLALVGSATDSGLKYWFPILDQDGDGWVGAGDVAHFYAERKLESENRNGIILADVRCLWIRLCAMSGVCPNGKGLDLNSLKELGKDDREFVVCALLIRRADTGNLINVATTVSTEKKDGA